VNGYEQQTQVGQLRIIMSPIRIVKGLDVPIAGAPKQVITDGARVGRVALIGADYNGLRPIMQVEEGSAVKLGQPLFADRKDERVMFTAPGSGRVVAINRGARRALICVVIQLGGDDEETFSSWSAPDLVNLRCDQVTDLLLSAGLWTAIRTRPYGRRADPDQVPAAIFVTAMDSHPLAPKAEVIIDADRSAFAHGLTVISHLTDGSVYVCQAPRANLPTGSRDNIVIAEFAGPHPAGLVGTHIHLLEPVSANKTVWHLNYQDVTAIGRLFTTGRLSVDRVVSLAGPRVKQPRLIRTRLGASIKDLIKEELSDENCRVISGSVLSGRHASGYEAYLGRFHNQVSVVGNVTGREMTSRGGRLARLFTAYSTMVTGAPVKRRYDMTTAQNGDAGAMVPFGGYDRVMPLDVLPTPLTRALMVGDTDMAQALGCLELEEEDLALCSYVCPSKIDHGSLLRQALEQIEKEG
jgi:Na+-transporting NADH:ubiquinone oxidoreductase subunit A